MRHVNADDGKPIPSVYRIAGAANHGKFRSVAVRRRRRVESRHMNSFDFVPDETWLRSRFVGRRTVEPVAAGDGHLWRSDREIRPAAVLVPVVKREKELTVLFTRRTAHLHDHAGQISFPGGRAEPGDAGAAETAMRETQEEIGLAAERVEVLGELPQYVT